jgi:hypothetical protein
MFFRLPDGAAGSGNDQAQPFAVGQPAMSISRIYLAELLRELVSWTDAQSMPVSVIEIVSGVIE